MALLLAAATAMAPRARAEPLPIAQTDSPYDVLLVANINAFPRNLDGSLRLPDPAAGVDISTCYLRDDSGKPFVWQAALRDRKQRNALEPLLDVQKAYSAQGVPRVVDEVQASLRRSLEDPLAAKGRPGRNGTARPRPPSSHGCSRSPLFSSRRS